jgi:hypothetical protein
MKSIYRVRQKTLTIFKLKSNEKYTIFLNKFITKIIFDSKHFNYDIHFLNTVSVRWRPLSSTHSRKRFWKFCITRCSMLGEITEGEVLRLGTLVPMNIKVPTKYPLSQDRIVVFLTFWHRSFTFKF